MWNWCKKKKNMCGCFKHEELRFFNRGIGGCYICNLLFFFFFFLVTCCGKGCNVQDKTCFILNAWFCNTWLPLCLTNNDSLRNQVLNVSQLSTVYALWPSDTHKWQDVGFNRSSESNLIQQLRNYIFLLLVSSHYVCGECCNELFTAWTRY